MLILLFILAILATVTCFVICVKNNFESFGVGMIGSLGGICGAVVVIILTVLMIKTIDSVVSGEYIDAKIQIYAEENQNIEVQIDSLVKNYMSFESNTYKEFKSDDAITLVSLYPDLKSDELIQEQIKVYIANNSKIKELKEKKIDVLVNKWWLYFGN